MQSGSLLNEKFGASLHGIQRFGIPLVAKLNSWQFSLIFSAATLANMPVFAFGNECDPNYSGNCVPIDSDVDCAGGKGNGLSYVKGPVFVIGQDVYGLDRDGDGVGCEPKSKKKRKR